MLKARSWQRRNGEMLEKTIAIVSAKAEVSQGRRQTLWQRVGDGLQTKASSGWDQAATSDALCGSPSVLPPARWMHSPFMAV